MNGRRGLQAAFAWAPAALAPRALTAVKAAVFAAALYEVARLLMLGASGRLGANPIELVERGLGKAALVMLLLTLAVMPLRRLTGWAWLPRLRRMLGLFTFFYAALHASAYVALDHRFDWPSIVEDIVKRPYLSFGFAAFVLMLPLAATSTDAMVRRLGARNWLRLHRLVYASAVLAVLHYGFHKQAKNALADPLFYATLLALLLGVRVLFALRRRGAAAQGRQDSAASSSATVSRRRTS